MPTRKNNPATISSKDIPHWEDSYETRFLLRSLIVMRPREPFMEWVRGLQPDFKDVTLEHGRRRGSAAFLVPAIGDVRSAEAFFEAHWPRFFSQALYRIAPQRKRWPKQLSLDMMKEWFDIETCAEVYDLGEGGEDDDREHQFLMQLRGIGD